MKWIALLLLALLAVGCEGTVPNIGERDKPKPRAQIQPQTHLELRQYVPKMSANVRFGFQVMAPWNAKIKMTDSGYLVSGNEIALTLERLTTTDVLANGLTTHSPAPRSMELQEKDGVFFSWMMANGEMFVLRCQGKVNKKLCGEVLASLQIIKR